MAGLKRWFWNVLVWIDQGVNVVFGWLLNVALRPHYTFGYPDETLSSVFGKNVRTGSCRFCGWICRLLDAVDPNHCSKSIESDEGDR